MPASITTCACLAVLEAIAEGPGRFQLPRTNQNDHHIGVRGRTCSLVSLIRKNPTKTRVTMATRNGLLKFHITSTVFSSTAEVVPRPKVSVVHSKKPVTVHDEASGIFQWSAPRSMTGALLHMDRLPPHGPPPPRHPVHTRPPRTPSPATNRLLLHTLPPDRLLAVIRSTLLSLISVKPCLSQTALVNMHFNLHS